MSTSRKALIGTIAFLIIGAGLVTGIYLSREKSAAQTKAQTPEKAEPNFTTYEISPTSRGVMLVTVDAPLTVADQNAFALLSKEEAANVKTGQKVLLYNVQGAALGKLGVVSAVTLDPATNKVNVAIKFDEEDKDVAPALVSKGTIITDDIPDAPRLPVSAVVQKDGAEYLWEVSANQDGTRTAAFKTANIVRKDKSYVVIGDETGGSNIFVLNPDAALREGQAINVKETLYAGPDQTEEDKTMMMIKKRKKPIRDPEFGKMSRPASTPTLNSPSSAACNPNVVTLEKFIRQIRKISNDDKLEERRIRLFDNPEKKK